MKITIIGGGNMGGSIAKGLTLGSIFKADDICVVDTNNAVLESITKFNKKINTSNNGTEVVKNADIVLIAVKPWLVNAVINSIKDSLNYEKQLIVSIANPDEGIRNIPSSPVLRLQDPSVSLFRTGRIQTR